MPVGHTDRDVVVCEPALRPDGGPLTPIHWETGDGRILGPAVPEFFMRDGDSFWIVTTFEGQRWWINADQLRSRQAFETQAPIQEVDIVRF
jgi:hypothetical protein